MPPQIDPRVDAYIAGAAPFAQPILTRLRADVHAACPDAEEAIKWSMPFFVHAGRNVAHMAAFKAHCAFGFEMGRAVVDLGREAAAMGQFGRVTKLDDLPPPADLRRMVKKAVALIDAGEKPPRAPKSGANGHGHGSASGSTGGSVNGNAQGNGGPEAAHRVRVPRLPAAFAQALARNAAAKRFFTTLAAGYRRDYIAWITEAQRAETRERRIGQAVSWLAEGKRRNWKYERA